MMSFLRSRGSVLVLALVVASCAPKKAEVVLNTEMTPPDTLLDLVREKTERIMTMEGSGILSFESPEIAGTASFEASMKKPDSLLVLLEGPFGIDVGTFFLSRQKYVVYNSLENSVITGVPSAHVIRSVIPFDLTYDEILNAFTGAFAIPQDHGPLLRYSIDGDLFFLSFKCGSATCSYWVDPRFLLVTRYMMSDTEGKAVVDAEATSFTEEEDLSAARRVVVRFPQERRQLSIVYRSLHLNDTTPSFEFTIPPNARVIYR